MAKTEEDVQATVEEASNPFERFFLDKTEIRKVVAETNRRMGFVPDPTATAEKARAMIRALGIRPEENLLSRAIIAARYEDE